MRPVAAYSNSSIRITLGKVEANEITNNFLGNPITADLTGKTHDKDMGHDIECLLVYKDKVNSFENYFYIL